jgi:NDP-sugar pyrophosphorylase family protein
MVAKNRFAGGIADIGRLHQSGNGEGPHLNAVILAAGKGSRLGSLTEAIPKPLIEFNGKTLLQHNIELCQRHGILRLFINTHHLAEKITTSFGDGSAFGVHITYSYESELLGTSGALWNFRQDLKNEPFYVLYGDNYSQYDLTLLKDLFARHDSMGVIAFHHREDVCASGVAEFDGDQRIVRFIEKPKQGETLSHWVNAGIYLLHPRIFEYIPEGCSDFARDVFPLLLAQRVPLYAVCGTMEVRAFDTPEMYERSMRRLT